MPKINRIVDSCIFHASEEWSYLGMRARKIRIAGLLPADSEHLPRVLRKMENNLVGKSFLIAAHHFIESGPILVADVDIAGVDLRDFFGDRLLPHTPRSRVLDPEDTRLVRRVRSTKSRSWNNPLSAVALEQRPSLGNLRFPPEPWLQHYREELRRVMSLFCDARAEREADQGGVTKFLTERSHPTMVLVGDCGCGKSWFIRHSLAHHPPPDTDVGLIDVSSFSKAGEPRLANFAERLQLKLAEILGEFVNKRPGGLMTALRYHLEREARGIFGDQPFENPETQAWCRQYLVELAKLANLTAYNALRLQSYGYTDRDLVLVIDNVDAFYKTDEQAQVFEATLENIARTDGVYIIMPMRPSTEFLAKRRSTLLQHQIFSLHLSPIDTTRMLNQRLTTSPTGSDLRHVRVRDGAREWTFLEVLNKYIGSDSSAIIRDLAQGDLRHYIRLFRRLFYSNELNGLANIGKEYHCLGALMLKPGEGFREDMSFVLNVFDNEHPQEIGNALIRWRVLEYFLRGHRQCEGEFFEYYYRRLGYDLVRVRAVIELWNDAGVLDLFPKRLGGEAVPTPCAAAYEMLVHNLWYCIAIKSGMHIDATYILIAGTAKAAARQYRIDVSGVGEWVSDAGFLEFLADEETLEEARLAAFPGKIADLEVKCRAQGPQSIHQRLWFSYTYQVRKWETARRRR